MPILDIDGVKVTFPYEAYDCQIEYMRNLLKALCERKHAILESPTGTGKTLCLLCTSLAWLDTFAPKEDVTVQSDNNGKCSSSNSRLFDALGPAPTIIYASRTHSQLSQAVAVLRNTVYGNRKISVLASRDQLCLLPELTMLDSNSAKVFACRARVQSRTCDYYRNFDLKRDDLLNRIRAENVVDIEDLVKLGKSVRCCPYYMSREMKNTADIVFMPYNYLLDAKIRRLYNIDLHNAVVIFDEAHNIEQVCEDSASVCLSSSQLASAIEYVRTVCEVVFSLTVDADDNESVGNVNISSFDISRAGEDQISTLNLDRLVCLKGQMIELERLIDELDLPEDGLTKTSDFLFDLFGRAGLTRQTKDLFLQTIDDILSKSAAAENIRLRKPKGISEVSEFIKTVFESKHSANLSLFGRDYSRCYRVFVKDERLPLKLNQDASVNGVWGSRAGTARNQTSNRSLSYWCLSPGRAMHDLIREQVRCVILTSGTLFPIEPIQAELNMSFPIVLQNPHVIKPDQIRLAVISRGPEGSQLNSSFASRDNPLFRSQLGLTLIELLRIVPCGLLVFFPSYSMMNQCVECWKGDSTYDRMVHHKQIFIEPRDKIQFTKVFSDYRTLANVSATTGGNGAALFAVMRGRASEGLDLSDYAGRGVAVLGLPYPPIFDSRIRLKMAYLDERHAETSNLASVQQKLKNDVDSESNVPIVPTGRTWYTMQAWRAVSQSIGRVIRHHRDFGAVFLCDERFAPISARTRLPRWMQPSLNVYSEISMAIKDIKNFYAQASIKYTPSRSTLSSNLENPNISTHNKLPLNDVAHLYSGSLSRQNTKLPKANEVDIFSEGMSQMCDSEETSNFLAEYTGLNSQSYQLIGSARSVFHSLDTQSGLPSSTTSFVESCNLLESKADDDDIEERLLSRRSGSSKRLRLSQQCSENTSAPVTLEALNRHVDHTAVYMQTIKKVLRTSSTNEKDHIQRLKDFKTALTDYRSNCKENSEDETYPAVHRLFKDLSNVFRECSDHNILLGAVCFLDPNHEKLFKELCANNPLKSSINSASVANSSSNATVPSSTDTETTIRAAIACSKCGVNPAPTPLVAVCGHVACFSCWRFIIEQDNRRCPACNVLVRRRNLSRIVPSVNSIPKS